MAFVAFELLHLFPATNATGAVCFSETNLETRKQIWKPARMQLGLWQVSGYLLGFSGSPKKYQVEEQVTMTTDGNESPRVDVLTRDESGRFAKGASGNPAGRPVGVKNYGSSLRLTDIYRDLSPMLLEDLMERFRAGDEKARDFLLPRLWPESPKFAAYMHEKAKEEDEWKEKTRKEIEEEISSENQRDDDDIKLFYLEMYLPEILVELFTKRGNFEIPRDMSKYIKSSDIDKAFIPDIVSMASAEASLFAANLVNAVIVHPKAARQALEAANFSEMMIYMVFNSIQEKHGNVMSGSLFFSLVNPCIRDNMSGDEAEKLLDELKLQANDLNRDENRSRERIYHALCKYDLEDDEESVGSDDEIEAEVN